MDAIVGAEALSISRHGDLYLPAPSVVSAGNDGDRASHAGRSAESSVAGE